MKVRINWEDFLKENIVKRTINSLQLCISNECNIKFLEDKLSYSKNRVIKDAIWGIIPITRFECALLDSPIMQRLRFIRQLGMAYLVYPTAGYSRFEHTLGVLHTIDHIISAIRYNAEINDYFDDINRVLKLTPIIKFAGLLHDIGHGPFSHVSEQFFQETDEESQELIKYFKFTLDVSIQRS